MGLESGGEGLMVRLRKGIVLHLSWGRAGWREITMCTREGGRRRGARDEGVVLHASAGTGITAAVGVGGRGEMASWWRVHHWGEAAGMTLGVGGHHAGELGNGGWGHGHGVSRL